MSVIRRQLFFLLVVGTAVSLAAEGRVTLWLVADASVSAAFMPVLQLVGFFVAWRLRVRGAWPETRDVAGFLDGNTAWLWWWCAIAILVSIAPPRSMGPSALLAFLAAIVLFGATSKRDWQWLRAGFGRNDREAAIDIATMRFITWGLGVAWFFGIAIWYGEVPKVAAWFA